MFRREFAHMNRLFIFVLFSFCSRFSFLRFLNDMGMNDCLQMAWEIVNDSYRLDLPLLYPPYLIAIAAIYITCNFQDKDYKPWLNSLNVDLDKIVEISRELMQLWEDADNYQSQTNQNKIYSLLRKLNGNKYQTSHQYKAQLNAKQPILSPSSNTSQSSHHQHSQIIAHTTSNTTLPLPLPTGSVPLNNQNIQLSSMQPAHVSMNMQPSAVVPSSASSSTYPLHYQRPSAPNQPNQATYADVVSHSNKRPLVQAPSGYPSAYSHPQQPVAHYTSHSYSQPHPINSSSALPTQPAKRVKY